MIKLIPIGGDDDIGSAIYLAACHIISIEPAANQTAFVTTIDGKSRRVTASASEVADKIDAENGRYAS